MNTAPRGKGGGDQAGEDGARPQRAADSRSSGCGLRTSRISVTSPTGSTPLTEPCSPVLCEPLTETCHRPAERRSQGLCPRVQKWFYEKFGEYVEDFRFQPEESAVETEEPLSARRWGPGGGLRAVGYSRTTQGPPVPGSQPCRREGPPWGGHAAVFPNPCGHAQACDRPHVGMVGTCPQARPG